MAIIFVSNTALFEEFFARCIHVAVVNDKLEYTKGPSSRALHQRFHLYWTLTSTENGWDGIIEAIARSSLSHLVTTSHIISIIYYMFH